jgi:hypothetical protein
MLVAVILAVEQAGIRVGRLWIDGEAFLAVDAGLPDLTAGMVCQGVHDMRRRPVINAVRFGVNSGSG